MDYRVDEKDEGLTTHVTRRNVPVTAQIAITDVQVREVSTDRRLYQTQAFINKQEIVWIQPHESTQPATAPNSLAR